VGFVSYQLIYTAFQFFVFGFNLQRCKQFWEFGKIGKQLLKIDCTVSDG